MENALLPRMTANRILRAKWIYVAGLLMLAQADVSAQIGISSSSITPHASSVLELRSTTSGFLPPRMTTIERDAISSPATGLLIYNTTTNQLNYYSGSAWLAVVTGGAGISSLNGLTGTTQTFVNGANLTMSSAGSTHTLGWTGQLSVARGGTGVSTFGGTNRLLYTTTTDNLSSVTTANNGVLVTDGSGVPSIGTTLPAAVQSNITTVGTIGTGVWNGTAIADGKIASALTGKTYNGLSLTPQSTGFTISGGTTSKTLTLAADANVSGTNTGDQTTITGNAGSATLGNITNDNTTAATMYPVWVANTSGNQAHQTSSSKLSFNPSTGILTATGFAGNLTGNVTGNASTVTTNANLTGDVTSVGNATTIAANAVTNAKQAQMAATTIKGNKTAGTANPTDLTGTEVAALLPTFTSSAPGVVPASGGGTDKFLRADGTFAIPFRGAVMTATSAAIGNTETKLLQYTIPANTLQVGTTYRITLFGTCTPGNTHTTTIRVRMGTTGTSSDVAAAVLAPTAANSGTNVPFSVSMMVTVRAIGASGTVDGNGVLTNFSYASGIEADGVLVGTPSSGVGINTTVSNIIHVSCVSSNNSTKSTFQIATIEAIN